MSINLYTKIKKYDIISPDLCNRAMNDLQNAKWDYHTWQSYEGVNDKFNGEGRELTVSYGRDQSITSELMDSVYTALQNYALALVFFIVAIASPILSSIADYRGNKKAFMRFFVVMGSISCAMLYFFTPDKIEWGIIFFALAALGFWSSLVFYNSYLPDIASPEERDALSARGFAMGYIGSVLLQLICFGPWVFSRNK